MAASDDSELRNAVGAIGLAVAMLREEDSAWLDALPTADRIRIRGVLRALHGATAELVAHVSPNAKAIAAETARALEARREGSRATAATEATAAGAPTAREAPAVVSAETAHLPAVMRRLEIACAVQAAPRPALTLRCDSDATVPIDAQRLVSALQSAVVGLVRSRPVARTAWNVVVSAQDHRGPQGEPGVTIELRCEVADESIARGPSGTNLGATLPQWLSECLRLAAVPGGDLARGRDGPHEVVSMTLPRVVASDGVVEAAANEAPAAGPRAVA